MHLVQGGTEPFDPIKSWYESLDAVYSNVRTTDNGDKETVDGKTEARECRPKVAPI